MDAREAAKGRDRGGVVAGIVIIGIGTFLLLAQLVPDIGRWIPLTIGLIFLAAFMAKREYGFLVPGGIVSGVGVGILLTGFLDEPWAGAAMMFSISAGFVAIWIMSTLLARADRDWLSGDGEDVAKALWWPLIPGGILAVIGLIVLAEEGFGSDLLQWWPLLLIGAGIVVLVTNLRRRDDQAS